MSVDIYVKSTADVDLKDASMSLSIFRTVGFEQLTTFLVFAYGKSGFTVENPKFARARGDNDFEKVRINPEAERISDDNPVDTAVLAMFNLNSGCGDSLDIETTKSLDQAIGSSRSRIDEIFSNPNTPKNANLLKTCFGMNRPLDQWTEQSVEPFVERLKQGVSEFSQLVSESAQSKKELVVW